MSPNIDQAKAPPDPASSPPSPRVARVLTRETAIYGLGDFAGRALSFISVPIYTRVFEPEQFSILSFLASLGGLLSAVLILGGDTAYTRYYFKHRSRQERRDLTVTWVGFLLGWAMLVVLLLMPLAGTAARWSFGPQGSASLFIVMLLSLPVGLASRMLAQNLRNEFRATSYAATGVATSALGISAALTLVLAFDMGVIGVLVGYLIADLVIALVRAFLVRDALRGRFRPSLLRPLLRYGAPLVVVSLCFWTFTMSDRIVLGKLGSLTELAHYSLAVAIGSVLVLCSGAVASAWTPRAFALYEADPDRAAVTVGGLIGYLVTLLGLLAVCLATGAAEIVRLLAPPAYHSAIGVTPLVLLGLVASGTALMTGTGIAISGRTTYSARYAGYAAAVNLVGALVMVPPWGIYGAAAASAAGFAQLTAAYLWRSQRLWPVPLASSKIVAEVALLALAMLLLSFEIVQDSAFKWLVVPVFIMLSIAFGPVPPASIRRIRRLVPQRWA